VLSGRVELTGVRSADDETSWLPGGEPDERAHSHLTVPITIGRNVIGAMTIQSAFRNAYGPRDKELLTAIALHTGIALENARLYRLVQTRGNRRAVVLDEVIHRQEAERKELVDTIHDDTLQTLAACLYRLDQAKVAVEKLDREAQAIVQLSDVRESLADNIDRLRRRIFALRPSTLDRLGLEPALRELLTRLRREYSIDTDLDVELATRLSADDETLVYRMVQEAIEYIVLSGGATYAGVTIRETGGNVTLKLVDDGAHPELSGHDDAPAGHIGLLALVERADLAGGNLRVARRAGGGSIMQIALPVTNRGDASATTDALGGGGVSYAGD
jgi:signal transduction histidine kinase